MVDGAHDDEYRWRKYGQKIMKGSPYPRSYYKCTAPNCSAKKLVESMMKDGKEITVASFRGAHSHPAPGARKGGVGIGGGFGKEVHPDSDGEGEKHDHHRRHELAVSVLLFFSFFFFFLLYSTKS